MSTLYAFLRAGALGLLPLAAAAQVNTNSPALLEVKTTDATPVTKLRLQTGSGLYLGGEYTVDASGSNVPAAGSGTRLMWYPEKAAFRAGYVNGTQWDAANIGIYSTAMGSNTRASGDYGVALGHTTVAANTGSVALGQYCTASGAASVALGNCAHTNARQGSFAFADRSVLDDGNSDSDEYFFATVNHSANWRTTGGFRVVTGGGLLANTDGDPNLEYVPTRGVSILPVTVTSGPNANVGTTNWNQTAALIATSSGAYLSDAGIWTNTSDRRKKHLFEAVSGEDVLSQLRQVPITRWSYKTDPAAVRHLGPMAQDFRRAFGLGQDSVSIGTVDADGVALAGVQALDARTRRLQAENAALRARLEALEQRAQVTGGAASFTPASLSVVAAFLLGSAGLGAVLLRRRP